MSSAVIGSPLTMTTICWACAAAPSADTPTARSAAVNRWRQIRRQSIIIAPSAVLFSLPPLPSTTIVYFSRAVELKRGAQLVRAAECPSTKRAHALCPRARSSAERAQGDLRHVGMVDRHAPAVGVACNVVQGQDEAVVDIADTDLGLGERLGMDVIPGSAQQDPVRVELETGSAENALAAVQEPDQRLGRVVAVQYRRRPAAKRRNRLELGALQGEVVLGEAEA